MRVRLLGASVRLTGRMMPVVRLTTGRHIQGYKVNDNDVALMSFSGLLQNLRRVGVRWCVRV
jgi:hypothetical protein